MKISISPGDMVLAKKHLCLYEKESLYSGISYVFKDNSLLVIAVKMDDTQVSLYVMSSKSGQLGWTNVVRPRFYDYFSVLAPA